MLVLRNIKNAELTWTEVDGNFLYLENKIDDLEQLVNGDEVVKVTQQNFMPGQQDTARANISAASLQQVVDLESDVSDIQNLEIVTYNLQSPTPQQQQQLRDNADVYSRDEITGVVQAEIATAIAALPPKPKGIYVRSLTSVDLAQATITLDLPDTPDVTDDYFLYVNGQFINDDDYLVQANKVVVGKSNIEFEIVEGMKVTFRYRY